MTATSFALMLLLIATVAAASADRPTFWLLLGPAPLAAAIGMVAFVQPRLSGRGHERAPGRNL